MDGSEALGVAEGLQRAADAEKAIILAEPRARHPISSFPPPQLLAATSDEQQLRDLKIQLLRSERERLSTHKRLNDLRKDLNSHEGANTIRHKELEQKMLGLLSDRPMSDAVRAAKQRVDEATFGMVAEQNALARVRRELAEKRSSLPEGHHANVIAAADDHSSPPPPPPIVEGGATAVVDTTAISRERELFIETLRTELEIALPAAQRAEQASAEAQRLAGALQARDTDLAARDLELSRSIRQQKTLEAEAEAAREAARSAQRAQDELRAATRSAQEQAAHAEQQLAAQLRKAQAAQMAQEMKELAALRAEMTAADAAHREEEQKWRDEAARMEEAHRVEVNRWQQAAEKAAMDAALAATKETMAKEAAEAARPSRRAKEALGFSDRKRRWALLTAAAAFCLLASSIYLFISLQGLTVSLTAIASAAARLTSNAASAGRAALDGLSGSILSIVRLVAPWMDLAAIGPAILSVSLLLCVTCLGLGFCRCGCSCGMLQRRGGSKKQSKKKGVRFARGAKKTPTAASSLAAAEEAVESGQPEEAEEASSSGGGSDIGLCCAKVVALLAQVSLCLTLALLLAVTAAALVADRPFFADQWQNAFVRPCSVHTLTLQQAVNNSTSDLGSGAASTASSDSGDALTDFTSLCAALEAMPTQVLRLRGAGLAGLVAAVFACFAVNIWCCAVGCCLPMRPAPARVGPRRQRPPAVED